MRHLRTMSKLGRNCGHRKALLVNLACSLIEHNEIKTTVNRAKAVRRLVDALITCAKKGGDFHRRLAARKLKINTPATRAQGKKAALEKLFGELAQAYAARPGGYTRIIRLGRRRGDGAGFCLIKLVETVSGSGKKTAPPPKTKTDVPQQNAEAAQEVKPASAAAGAHAEAAQEVKPASAAADAKRENQN